MGDFARSRRKHGTWKKEMKKAPKKAPSMAGTLAPSEPSSTGIELHVELHHPKPGARGEHAVRQEARGHYHYHFAPAPSIFGTAW